MARNGKRVKRTPKSLFKQLDFRVVLGVVTCPLRVMIRTPALYRSDSVRAGEL